MISDGRKYTVDEVGYTKDADMPRLYMRGSTVLSVTLYLTIISVSESNERESSQ